MSSMAIPLLMPAEVAAVFRVMERAGWSYREEERPSVRRDGRTGSVWEISLTQGEEHYAAMDRAPERAREELVLMLLRNRLVPGLALGVVPAQEEA
jgi:hypothetical protein